MRAWTIAHSRSHSCAWTLYHLLRFSKACPRAGILLRRSASFWHRAHALLALCSIFDPMLIWWLQARIVYLSTRSAPQSDRSPHEGASCTTMSLFAYFRTPESRSFQFFWTAGTHPLFRLAFSVVQCLSHLPDPRSAGRESGGTRVPLARRMAPPPPAARGPRCISAQGDLPDKPLPLSI